MAASLKNSLIDTLLPVQASRTEDTQRPGTKKPLTSRILATAVDDFSGI
jgi:hypothetical protein